jgi:hypothetical protein
MWWEEKGGPVGMCGERRVGVKARGLLFRGLWEV